MRRVMYLREPCADGSPVSPCPRYRSVVIARNYATKRVREAVANGATITDFTLDYVVKGKRIVKAGPHKAP